MRTQKIAAFFAVLAVVFQLLIPNGFAVYEPVIKVEDVTALKGTNVTVPVKLTGNTGICGAVMYITYDEALTLTAVTKGEALPGLAMTPPGDLSKNPVKVMFDGLEGDYSDGVIINLSFDVPEEVGTYDVAVSYEDEEIVDGNLKPVDIEMLGGSIKVTDGTTGGGGSGDTGDGSDDGETGDGTDLPVLSFDDITAGMGESVTLPLRLSGNTGICGAVFYIAYSESLKLTNITRGDALNSLVATMPGDLNANPIKLLYDGMEADATDGILVNLTFTVPQEFGTYDISVYYDDGEVVDGNLKPLKFVKQSGSITVYDPAGGGDEGGGDTGDDGDDDDDDIVDESKWPVISIGTVKAESGEIVEVPVSISGNTGLCGAVFDILYDESLTLNSITKGEALSDLVMTIPGKLSANPIKLLYDGMDADSTNGTIAILTFTAPQQVGTYDISVSCEYGEIVDGDLLPVNVKTQSGGITVEKKEVIVEVEVGNKNVTLVSDSQKDGIIYVAFYRKDGTLSSVKAFKPDSSRINAGTDTDAFYSKVMWWSDDQKPMADEVEIVLTDTMTVEVGNETTTLTANSQDMGYSTAAFVYVAFYKNTGEFISVKLFSPDSMGIRTYADLNADYAEVMWWGVNQTPISDVQRITLK